MPSKLSSFLLAVKNWCAVQIASHAGFEIKRIMGYGGQMSVSVLVSWQEEKA